MPRVDWVVAGSVLTVVGSVVVLLILSVRVRRLMNGGAVNPSQQEVSCRDR